MNNLSQIKKEDIEIPKEDIELLDYPPKAKIYVDAVSTDGNSSSPQLLVKGLDGGQKKLKLIIPSKLLANTFYVWKRSRFL